MTENNDQNNKKLNEIEKKGIQISKKGKIEHRRDIDNPSPPLSNLTIIFDPGNGGKDETGKYFGTQDILELCLLIKEGLEKLGAEILLTRTDDRFCPLSDKVKQASEINPQFFISINCNCTKNATLSGTEIFHYRGDEESAELAQLICEKLKQHTLLRQKGVKVADLTLNQQLECFAR